MDTESVVTLIPPDKERIKDKKLLPITRKYQEVNKNEVKFAGRIKFELTFIIYAGPTREEPPNSRLMTMEEISSDEEK